MAQIQPGKQERSHRFTHAVVNPGVETDRGVALPFARLPGCVGVISFCAVSFGKRLNDDLTPVV